MYHLAKAMTWTRFAVTLLLVIFSATQLWTQTLRHHEHRNAMGREMRGLWVAVVGNIDWPSSPGLSSNALRREATEILDRAKRMGLNTIFLQVRPSSDAIYRSSIEPMSYYMVGQNVDGECDFDALQFWIDEAHRRGLELHAWINPFRVNPKADFPCGAQHISKRHPEWIITYAGKAFLDPGISEARGYVVSVIDDIVEHYDVDGIHFDDYFYPYPVKGEPSFNDAASYSRNNPLNLSLDQWRRSNVDSVICSVAKTLSHKPWIRFGVSPFGVWRNVQDDPRGSDTHAGTTDYDVLYADVLSWIEHKWVDYVVPQVYWEMGNKAADFDKVSAWWAGVCDTTEIDVYVGHGLHKINNSSKPWENGLEMPSQVRKVREDKRLGGSVFFSYRQFNRNILGLEEALRSDIYSYPSLAPAKLYPSGIDLKVDELEHHGNMLTWTVSDTSSVRFYIVYRYPKGHPQEEEIVDIVGSCSYQLNSNTDTYAQRHRNTSESSSKRKKYVFRVAAVDKYGIEYEKSRREIVKY